MTDSAAASGNEQEPLGVVARPPFQLTSLPAQYRWEVTRRHPYYQQWWQLARDHHQNAPTSHQADESFRIAALTMLSSIGVSGEPPHPETDFEDLDANQVDTTWLSGAVQPMTLRGIASLLIAALPKETVGYVGMMLMEASCDDKAGEPPRKIKALLDLSRSDKPSLDAFPDIPFVSVNPAASGRQVSAAMAELHKHWKDQWKLGETRDRSDKYPDYLRVWDMREGWINGTYNRGRELFLVDIATKLELSVSTVHNQYRSAFELIVGHAYSPMLWYRVFGPLKISELYGCELGPVSRSRPSKSPTRREVPESVVSPRPTDNHLDGLTDVPVSNSFGFDVGDLIAKIRRLLDQGYSDDAVLAKLDLSTAALKAVAYVRKRGDELT